LKSNLLQLLSKTVHVKHNCNKSRTTGHKCIVLQVQSTCKWAKYCNKVTEYKYGVATQPWNCSVDCGCHKAAWFPVHCNHVGLLTDWSCCLLV